jgi:hypothetical protein
MLTIRSPEAPAGILALTMRSWPAHVSTAHMPYRDRYWNDAYLDALAEIHRSSEAMVSMRGAGNAERNDGAIIGASSLERLRHKLTAVTEGPLPVS